ncbi:MAG: cache domain-containing protein [Desulfobulbaceae bacterium]|nr:cache domain-containing protein [Desulfobulbaceae bacterium]
MSNHASPSASPAKWHCTKGKLLLAVAPAILLVFLFVYPFHGSPKADLRQQTFARLDKIRQAKKQEIIHHFTEARSTALAIKDDPVMRGCFNALRKDNGDRDAEYEADKRYAATYGDFYDILFVDADGQVFHSIKKEEDYHTNLLRGATANPELAKALARPGEKEFVPFQDYSPSAEAAAFFAVSLQSEGRHLGWFVLQFSANRINGILTNRAAMGRTGEVYLVNQERLMLTDSRFMEDSTILRQRVDTRAVKEALRQKHGADIITDYRGVPVFSSYEQFQLFGASWIIIAEIDEDEVLTEHYKNHRQYFRKVLVRDLATVAPRPAPPPSGEQPVTKRVEMNEFARGEAGRLLFTEGVATCTAAVISYPGRFSYLAHISPTDEIYLDNPATRIFLGNRYHNFLGELLDRIEYFEVTPFERRSLRVALIAPHTDSFAKAVDALLARDIELGNITFLYHPKALSADVVVDATGETLLINWHEEGRTVTENGLAAPPLGMRIKKIIGYEA